MNEQEARALWRTWAAAALPAADPAVQAATVDAAIESIRNGANAEQAAEAAQREALRWKFAGRPGIPMATPAPADTAGHPQHVAEPVRAWSVVERQPESGPPGGFGATLPSAGPGSPPTAAMTAQPTTASVAAEPATASLVDRLIDLGNHRLAIPVVGSTAVAIALVVVLLVVGPGQGALPSVGGQSAAAVSPASTPSSAGAGLSDQALATAINIDTAALPAGWTKVDEQYVGAAQLAGPSSCVRAPARLAPDTAKFQRGFGYKLTAQGAAEGSLVVSIALRASATVTSDAFKVVSSDAYVPCVTAAPRSFLDDEGTPPTGSTTLLGRSSIAGLSLPGYQYETVTPYLLGGHSKLNYETDIHISGGRATAHVQIDRCCSNSQDPTWKALIATVSRYLAGTLQHYGG